MGKHEIIGDVHGAGLIAGVELVRDRQTREPARNEAKFTLNRVRENGVFIGRTGHRQSTLKIRLPMVFGTQEADLLTEVLDGTLSEIRKGQLSLLRDARVATGLLVTQNQITGRPYPP